MKKEWSRYPRTQYKMHIQGDSITEKLNSKAPEDIPLAEELPIDSSREDNDSEKQKHFAMEGFKEYNHLELHPMVNY